MPLKAFTGLFSACYSSKSSHILNLIGDELGHFAMEGSAAEEADSTVGNGG